MVSECCDICGKSHQHLFIEPLLLAYGVRAVTCLDCSSWLDDQQRFERLLENGLIDQDIYDALMRDEEYV